MRHERRNDIRRRTDGTTSAVERNDIRRTAIVEPPSLPVGGFTGGIGDANDRTTTPSHGSMSRCPHPLLLALSPPLARILPTPQVPDPVPRSTSASNDMPLLIPFPPRLLRSGPMTWPQRPHPSMRGGARRVIVAIVVIAVVVVAVVVVAVVVVTVVVVVIVVVAIVVIVAIIVTRRWWWWQM
ncbi:hypothetical protein M413DRAFT_30042 [Hebeloma cylindrosporum]|uniref:Uncharacterized protein n=1 Tax=Hebeloma cylindrosporum TaxID=76867 RepID=A0A0C2YBW5_HEBCY|nr:hypothetical protein M413DRAFT_30042 [Hebeloma cylindrosporum h7]